LTGLKPLCEVEFVVELYLIIALIVVVFIATQSVKIVRAQIELQAAYKKELKERFNIMFNQLFTITNMPIKRFGSYLISQGQFEPYMQQLKEHYSAANLESVMCRSLLSIDWQGYAYDCDFNQMLDLPLNGQGQTHLSELLETNVEGMPIAVMDHCYGCTAGQGSSCSGALD